MATSTTSELRRDVENIISTEDSSIFCWRTYERLAWKDIVIRYRQRYGGEPKEAMLQMRMTRLQRKLNISNPGDRRTQGPLAGHAGDRNPEEATQIFLQDLINRNISIFNNLKTLIPEFSDRPDLESIERNNQSDLEQDCSEEEVWKGFSGLSMADGESRRLREAFVRAKTESVSQLLARDRKIASLEEKIENLLQARDEKIAKLELERESMLSAFQDIQSGFKGTFDLTKKKIDEFSKRFMTVIILD